MLMLSVRECLKKVTCSRAVSESRQSSTEEVIIISILKNTNFFLHSVLIVIIFIWKYYRLPMSCSKTLNNSRSRCSRPFCVWFCTYMLMVWDLKLMHAFIQLFNDFMFVLADTDLKSETNANFNPLPPFSNSISWRSCWKFKREYIFLTHLQHVSSKLHRIRIS